MQEGRGLFLLGYIPNCFLKDEMVMVVAIETAIEDTATHPASASVAGDSVTAQDIGQLIKGDRYLGAKVAAAKIHCGIQLFKAESPGAG